MVALIKKAEVAEQPKKKLLKKIEPKKEKFSRVVGYSLKYPDEVIDHELVGEDYKQPDPLSSPLKRIKITHQVPESGGSRKLWERVFNEEEVRVLMEIFVAWKGEKA